MFNFKGIAAAAVSGIKTAKENKAVRVAAGLAVNGAVAAAQIKYGIPAVLAANAASRTLMRPDETVQGMVFSRALDLCGGDTVENRLNRLEGSCRAGSPTEECAALKEERLGRIGAYLRGEVTAAFSTDVGSLNIKGHKLALGLNDPTALRSLVRTASDFKAKKRADSTPWCEVWVKPHSIEGCWVAESLLDERPQLIQELEERGYAVEVVSDKDIISDGLKKAGEVQLGRLGFGRLQKAALKVANKAAGEGLAKAFLEGYEEAKKREVMK